MCKRFRYLSLTNHIPVTCKKPFITIHPMGALYRLSKNLHGRCRRARRPSDCIRIAGLCRAGGAFSAFSRKHSLHGGAAGRAFQARPATECNPRKSARSTFSTRSTIHPMGALYQLGFENHDSLIAVIRRKRLQICDCRCIVLPSKAVSTALNQV